MPTPTTEALVIGGSLAGLVTARVLADHVDHVTVLERRAEPAWAHDFRVSAQTCEGGF
jgi:2-polyprenyl-6-methoxyphenol hydroxylase-like FAD-dependent oxidoreductase